jgi:hypothetical protein
VELVLKVVAGKEREMIARFSSIVRELAGEDAAEAARIRRVFPEGTGGHRGRLFTADLPDDFDESLIRDLLFTLVDSGIAEYAGPPNPRRPL